MSDSIRIRVRKLLALASDPAATENEKAVAMQKAEALIEAHNIELGELGDADTIEIMEGDRVGFKMKHPYHRIIGSWVARLYDCRHVMWAKGEAGHSFVGMRHQVEAAEETFLWITAQVEELYRQALKAFDGALDKSQRRELRASFKDACAVKIGMRVKEIIDRRDSTGRHSRALVVINTAAEKTEDFMKNLGVKTARPIALREGFGTGAGFNAGDHVRIQKEVRP